MKRLAQNKKSLRTQRREKIFSHGYTQIFTDTKRDKKKEREIERNENSV